MDNKQLVCVEKRFCCFVNVEGKQGGWGAGSPLADHFGLAGNDGQPHPAVGHGNRSKEGLEVQWGVRHKGTVICILNFKDLHYRYLNGCL